MAKNAYIGVSNVAKKVSKMYIGVGGVAKKVKKAYIGVGGVAKLFFSGDYNVDTEHPITFNLISPISGGKYTTPLVVGYTNDYGIYGQMQPRVRDSSYYMYFHVRSVDNSFTNTTVTSISSPDTNYSGNNVCSATVYETSINNKVLFGFHYYKASTYSRYNLLINNQLSATRLSSDLWGYTSTGNNWIGLVHSGTNVIVRKVNSEGTSTDIATLQNKSLLSGDIYHTRVVNRAVLGSYTVDDEDGWVSFYFGPLSYNDDGTSTSVIDTGAAGENLICSDIQYYQNSGLNDVGKTRKFKMLSTSTFTSIGEVNKATGSKDCGYHAMATYLNEESKGIVMGGSTGAASTVSQVNKYGYTLKGGVASGLFTLPGVIESRNIGGSFKDYAIAYGGYTGSGSTFRQTGYAYKNV